MTWDERYSSGEGRDLSPEPLVVTAASLVEPGTALDLACGLGRHAMLLAGAGWEVTAVDSSSYAIEQLRNQPGINPVLADLEKGEFQIRPAAFRLIVDTLYLQRDLFPSMIAGLEPGGLLVCVLPMQDSDPAIRPMNPNFLVHPGELPSLVAPLEIVRYEEIRPAPQSRLRAELLARKSSVGQ